MLVKQNILIIFSNRIDLISYKKMHYKKNQMQRLDKFRNDFAKNEAKFKYGIEITVIL